MSSWSITSHNGQLNGLSGAYSLHVVSYRPHVSIQTMNDGVIWEEVLNRIAKANTENESGNSPEFNVGCIFRGERDTTFFIIKLNSNLTKHWLTYSPTATTCYGTRRQELISWYDDDLLGISRDYFTHFNWVIPHMPLDDWVIIHNRAEIDKMVVNKAFRYQISSCNQLLFVLWTTHYVGVCHIAKKKGMRVNKW